MNTLSALNDTNLCWSGFDYIQSYRVILLTFLGVGSGVSGYHQITTKIRVGIKIWLICVCNGYTYAMKICTRKQLNQTISLRNIALNHLRVLSVWCTVKKSLFASLVKTIP